MPTEDERNEWRDLIYRDPITAYTRAFGSRWAILFEKLPEHMRVAVAAYILLGDRPGDFLYAVVANNLMDSFLAADDVNRKALLNYAVFLHEAAPPAAFRDVESVETWIRRGGAIGTLEESQS